MNRTVLVSAALLVSLTACGGGNTESGGQASSSGNKSSAVSGSGTAKPGSAKSERVVLSKVALTDALLGINDLPAGYSQDPPSKPSAEKTFCGYKPPFRQKLTVSRAFTKGGGLSSQALSVILRQYGSADEAKASFDALTKALDTCHGETFEGSKVTYMLMSAPKVGDGTVGVRTTLTDSTALQHFALVGPTLVSAGGAGLTNLDGDEVARLLKDQVNAYDAAATK